MASALRRSRAATANASAAWPWSLSGGPEEFSEEREVYAETTPAELGGSGMAQSSKRGGTRLVRMIFIIGYV
jgi:predicted membrane-bound dolichyl-phosphate-mannose-protein mannosyltransferase